MKKSLFALAFILIGLQTHSQTFEGIVQWSMTSEITDPKVKAQMAEAKKQMNDPEKLKDMEAQMNDPQFKAMLESNPQMKAQMEGAIKMMQGGDLSSMMPTSTTIKIKNGSTRMSMEGGIMANTEILYLKDKNQSYRIYRSSKTYNTLPKDASLPNQKAPDVKVTKTTETLKILGYTCHKYVVKSTLEDLTTTQIFWSTTDIKDFDMKSLSQQRMANSSQAMFYNQIDGVPLKIEMTMPQGKMIMEAKEIKRQSLPAADFVIPADYKEVEMKFK